MILKLVMFVCTLFGVELSWHDKYVIDNCSRCPQCCSYSDENGDNPWMLKTDEPSTLIEEN